MFRKSNPFFIYTLTPLHAGSGDSLGVIDMPIQRERHTSYPKIEGSSLKGSIREAFEEEAKKKVEGKNNNITMEKIKLAFGPEDSGDEHAGALGFTDARLLLFPVKSVKGVFAYITCPSVIRKFNEELKLCKKTEIGNIEDINQGECIVTKESKLKINNNIILEEYAFNIKKEESELANKIKSLLNNEDITFKLAILSDEDFKDFVNLSTEVITRTKIDNETGTVDKKAGALFTEEYLPTESIMYSLALASPVFVGKKDSLPIKTEDDVMNFFTNGINEIIQIGGNATLGKGIVRIIKHSEGGKQ